MRLAPRLVLTTTAAVFVTSSISGAMWMRLERRQLIEDVVDDVEVLGLSLQAAVDHALRDGQLSDVEGLVRQVRSVAPAIELMVVSEGATVVAVSPGSRPDGDVERRLLVRSATRPTLHVRANSAGELTLYRGLPVGGHGGAPSAALLMVRPLQDLELDVAETTQAILWSMLLFFLATIVVLHALLRAQVTRNLERLAAAAAALGRDLNAPIEVAMDQADELAELSASLATMQAQLAAEREARAAQHVERERLHQQLREADKLVVVGQLAAAVAHEIGSPLQVLVGWANLLSTDTNASETVHRRATLIGEQASRIARIVGRMQDIVRRRPPNDVHTRLGEVVRPVVWLLEPEARRRGVRFELVASDGSVWADADELQQVVLNLALNAIQWAATRVRVEVRDAPTGVQLVVEDDGPGIPEASLSRVFEPLFTTRGGQGGTGLGLAVVRWIADRQRADLSVDRSPLGGARVTVRWSSERAP